MADFTPEQKRFAVRACGRGHGLSDVAQMMKEVFDLPAPPPTSQIARYNPTLLAGEGLTEALKDLFYEEREKAKADEDAVPLSDDMIRRRELADLFYRAKAAKNTVVAAKLLEQIAKEKGGMYQRSNTGASQAEVMEFLRECLAPVRAAIDAHVTDPEVRERVLGAISEAGQMEG